MAKIETVDVPKGTTEVFGHVQAAAKQHNDWRLWGLIEQSPRFGHNRHGVAVVERPTAPSGRPGTEWATIEWAIEVERVVFFSGHYDFTFEEALDDFRDRL